MPILIQDCYTYSFILKDDLYDLFMYEDVISEVDLARTSASIC